MTRLDTLPVFPLSPLHRSAPAVDRRNDFDFSRPRHELAWQEYNDAIQGLRPEVQNGLRTVLFRGTFRGSAANWRNSPLDTRAFGSTGGARDFAVPFPRGRPAGGKAQQADV